MLARIISRWKEWRYSRRSNQVRIAPPGVRGRVYEVKSGDPTSPNIAVKLTPKVRMTMRVVRADGSVGPEIQVDPENIHVQPL